MFKKYLTYGLAAFALTALATACSDDDLDADNGGNGGVETTDGPGAYIAVEFSLPSASTSRSETTTGGSSSSGTEEGKADENAVQEVAIILAGPDNKYVTSSLAKQGVDDGVVDAQSSTLYRAVTQLEKTDIKKFYTEDPTTKISTLSSEYKNGIHVFVVCNPTKSFKTLLENTAEGDNTWYDAYTKVVETSSGSSWVVSSSHDNIWSSGNFLMSNYEICTRRIPEEFDAWNSCNSNLTPFKLSNTNYLTFVRTDGTTGSCDVDNNAYGGAIKVQRAAARFDYKAGGTDYSGQPSRYKVIYMDAATSEAGDNSDVPYIDVELKKISLVNMGKDAFLFKRVSNDGSMNTTSLSGTDNAVTLCGSENGVPYAAAANYVVDYDWKWKQEACAKWNIAQSSSSANNNAIADDPDINSPLLQDHYNFPMFEANLNTGVFDFPSASQRSIYWYTTKIESLLSSSNKDQAGEYSIWRYAQENCIPAEASNQVNGLSTGVVFKARIRSANATNAIVNPIFDYYEQKLHDALEGNQFPNHADGTNPDTGKDYSKSQSILYLMNGMLYYTWEHVRAQAIVSALGGQMPTFTANEGAEQNASGGYDDGTWSFSSIAKNNPEYMDVFGDGGFGKFKMTLVKDNATYTGWIQDTEVKTIADLDQSSPNYLACIWNGDDPVTGEQTGSYRSGDNADTNEANFKKAVTGNGITIYQASYDVEFGSTNAQDGWGYYCYYYYWNRHNDNNDNSVMGPMEFAVVRNNVYKLYVSKISRLGHPRLIENDPNPPTPGSKDETDVVYLQVQCQVMPWVVRNNNIVF